MRNSAGFPYIVPMKKPKQILEDEKAPASVLLALVIKAYGTDCFNWEPAVLKAELNEDYDCDLTDLQSDKIQAAISVLTTDTYENSIIVFEATNYLFNHQLAHLDEMHPLEAEELIIGLTEAYIIRAEKLTFSPEVRVYAGVVFQQYGFHKPPKLFPSALMQEKDGNDKEKDEALQEIFNEKIKVIEDYLDNVQL